MPPVLNFKMGWNLVNVRKYVPKGKGKGDNYEDDQWFKGVTADQAAKILLREKRVTDHAARYAQEVTNPVTVEKKEEGEGTGETAEKSGWHGRPGRRNG